ncbi:MAG: radical SAM protein [Planctomycetes bacterium]|nr:radical SAM protein [Planctomycetota bacterium]
MRSNGSILLISCYELGHQPMGVALPMGFLQRAGFAADAMDIAVENFDTEKIARAGFIGISVPMHTAMRLGVRVAERIHEINPECHICFYGLYAALNSDYLLDHNADSCIGGEYETPLVALAESVETGSDGAIPGVIQRGKSSGPFLQRLEFAVPDRTALPVLDEYAHLEQNGDCRTAGYVEASRGCLHLCTHCPIPPVYGGRFFIVPKDVVLEDIRSQVRAGAKHITFGDPDFLNGPKHSLSVVRAMHAEFPSLTFDFTAKIEHLLNRGDDLPEFAELGCLFIISAVESLSGRVLKILDKEHSQDDFIAVLEKCRDAGIPLRPTWVAFTPWTTLDDYLEMLDFVEANGLIDNVDPVQFAIRLLIPPGSWLADHPETLPYRGPLDEAAFIYRWEHPDPQMDRLHADVLQLVERDAEADEDAATTFYRIRELAHGREPDAAVCLLSEDRERVPRLSESWFC